jgi:hypothetical protein
VGIKAYVQIQFKHAFVGVILEHNSGKVKLVGTTRPRVDMRAPYYYDLRIGKSATGITELYLQRKRNGDAMDRGRRMDAQTHAHTQRAYIRTRTHATASLHLHALACTQAKRTKNAGSGTSMTRGVLIKNTRDTKGRTEEECCDVEAL